MAKRKSLEMQMREILRETKAETEERLERSSKLIAKKCAKGLKEVSKKRSGEYSKGWRWRTEGKGTVVYNTTKPHLTHLLNDGHAKANQYGSYPGRVNGDHHIDDMSEKCSMEFLILNKKSD